MAFTDELNIHLKAGDGGSGVVRWLRQKFMPKGGPAGGDGGRGGDVWIEAVRDTSLLTRYEGIKEMKAEDGERGRSRSQHGKNGEDLILKLPVGSVVKNLMSGITYELLIEGEKHKVLEGGSGGKGNEYFKSSSNQRPQETTSGKEGEEADFYIELKLVVDAGFIGFPNAGKSTLLNTLTNAEAKVGNYAFTTLSPNLGDFYGFVLADIPGLIEGASEGKGLGHTFLRHISRTRMLIHCIAATDEDLERSYDVIRSELGRYDRLLLDKPELVVITKSDECSEEGLKEKSKKLKKYTGRKVCAVSVLDDDLLKGFTDVLAKELEENAR